MTQPIAATVLQVWACSEEMRGGAAREIEHEVSQGAERKRVHIWGVARLEFPEHECVKLRQLTDETDKG